MVAATTTAEEFRIGRVIERTFAVLGRNFVTFIVLAALAEIPRFALNLTLLQVPGATPTARLASAFASGGTTLLTFLLSLVLSLVLQGALTRGAFADLTGKRASIGDCLMTGLGQLLPLAAIGLLGGIGVAFGLILLIVPGLMLALAWSVIGPVRVVERTSVFGTFGRSAELTRGHRWAILGLYVIAIIAVMIVGLLVGVVAGGGLVLTGGLPGLTVVMLVQSIFQVFMSVVIATGVASLYYELRSIKEGIGPEQLAAVFD